MELYSFKSNVQHHYNSATTYNVENNIKEGCYHTVTSSVFPELHRSPTIKNRLRRNNNQLLKIYFYFLDRVNKMYFNSNNFDSLN